MFFTLFICSGFWWLFVRDVVDLHRVPFGDALPGIAFQWVDVFRWILRHVKKADRPAWALNGFLVIGCNGSFWLWPGRFLFCLKESGFIRSGGAGLKNRGPVVVTPGWIVQGIACRAVNLIALGWSLVAVSLWVPSWCPCSLPRTLGGYLQGALRF